MSRTRIQFLSDESPLREKLLSRLYDKYEVINSLDEADALAMALVTRPELVVVDLDSQQFRGLEFVARLRRHPSLGELPIVGYSEKRTRNDVLTAVRVGVNDYLINEQGLADSLVEKIDRWLSMTSADGDDETSRTEDVTRDEREAYADLFLSSIEAGLYQSESWSGHPEFSDPDSRPQTGTLENWVNPFILHTARMFEMMLEMRIRRTLIELKTSFVPSHDVSGMIEMKGQAEGVAVLSLSRELAFRVVNVILDKRVSQVNDDVMDAVGELTNIISGRASGDLQEFKTKIGLPSVLIGRTKVAPFPKSIKPICISFDSPGGPLSLEIGLVMARDADTPAEAALCS